MIIREITTRIKSILIWAAAFAFFIIGGMTEFNIFEDGGGQELNQFIQSMPRLMRVIYGMEGVDISTFQGYFGILLLYVLLMVAIHGAFLGSSLIHLEFKDRTADFLFVKPMARSSILSRKLLGGLAVILILEVFIAACCFYIFSSTDSLSILPKTLAAIVMTHIFFYTLGFLLSIALPKSKMGQQGSLLFIVISYFSISLSQLYSLPWLASLSPVGWYNTWIYKAEHSSYLLATGIFLLLSIIFCILAINRFKTKDIPA